MTRPSLKDLNGPNRLFDRVHRHLVKFIGGRSHLQPNFWYIRDRSSWVKYLNVGVRLFKFQLFIGGHLWRVLKLFESDMNQHVKFFNFWCSGRWWQILGYLYHFNAIFGNLLKVRLHIYNKERVCGPIYLLSWHILNFIGLLFWN